MIDDLRALARNLSNPKDRDLILLVIKNLNSNGTKISTTMIKSFIKKGNIQKANILLGREYFINTKAIKGKGIGAKIGFPTINVQPEEKIIALPKNGVYVSKIKYKNIF